MATPQDESDRQSRKRADFEKAIGEEEADGLSLLIVVGACGVFAAVLRNHAEIIRANVKSAALPFPQGPHSPGRCHNRFSLRARKVHGKGLQDLNGPRATWRMEWGK
jgi:hypothetical protein